MKRITLFFSLISAIGNTLAGQQFLPGIEKGRASYYGERFHGLRTASGERFDMYKFTAAHRRLPFGSLVRVTHIRNQKSVIVRINDRGPFIRNRIIDVSKAAAKEIGLIGAGSGQVILEVLKAENQKIRDSVSAFRGSDGLLSAENYLPGKTYDAEGRIVNLQGFGFQTGVFTDLISAREACMNLMRKGEKEVFIQVAESREGKIYRVIFRNFPDIRSAREAQNCLSEIGAKGFVRAF